MADLTVFVDNTAPTVADTITTNGTAVDLTSATVKFKMREAGSSTLKVNASATVTDAASGAVSYTWVSGDTDTAGDYRAWWEVTIAGAVQDTPEFSVAILAHDETSTAGWLCTIDDYRDQSEQANKTTTPDYLIAAFIGAATDAINARTEREIVAPSGSITRRFRVTDRMVFDIKPYDMYAVPDTVTLDPEEASPTTLTVDSDYTFRTVTGPFAYRTILLYPASTPYTSTLYLRFGFSYVDITSSTWGMYSSTTTVPEDIRRACVLTVASWLDRAISEYAIQSFDEGNGYRPTAMTGWPIPSAAIKLLHPYMMKTVV